MSPLDILIKYRQKLKNGKWSNIRTPKHIHWTVDILMKMQTFKELTQKFLDFFIDIWNSTKPIRSEEERQSLDLKNLLEISKEEIERFRELSKKGEYSVRFFNSFSKTTYATRKN